MSFRLICLSTVSWVCKRSIGRKWGTCRIKFITCLKRWIFGFWFLIGRECWNIFPLRLLRNRNSFSKFLMCHQPYLRANTKGFFLPNCLGVVMKWRAEVNYLRYTIAIILKCFFNNTLSKMRYFRLLIWPEELLFVLLMWKCIFA